MFSRREAQCDYNNDTIADEAARREARRHTSARAARHNTLLRATVRSTRSVKMSSDMVTRRYARCATSIAAESRRWCYEAASGALMRCRRFAICRAAHAATLYDAPAMLLRYAHVATYGVEAMPLPCMPPALTPCHDVTLPFFFHFDMPFMLSLFMPPEALTAPLLIHAPRAPLLLRAYAYEQNKATLPRYAAAAAA